MKMGIDEQPPVPLPLLRLPGGYNPNQVAHQIVTQCGDHLDRSG